MSVEAPHPVDSSNKRTPSGLQLLDAERVSPEFKQAAIATYAEKMTLGIKRMRLLDNVITIASSPEADRQEAFSQPDDEALDKYLTSLTPEDYETLVDRAHILSAYKDFAPDIEKLAEDIQWYDFLQAHPSQLGEGSRASAHSFEHYGETYVARLSRSGPEDPVSSSIIDARIAGGARAKGLPHFEQVVAASYEAGVYISRPMSGKGMDKLNSQQIDHISKEHFGELAESLVAADEHDILLDFETASNFLYDEEEGIGLIDFGAARKDAKPRLPEVFDAFGELLTRASVPDDKLVSAEDFEIYRKNTESTLHALVTFREAAAERLSEKASEQLKLLDARIASTRATLANVSSPDWVQSAIKEGGWLSPDTPDVV